MKYFGEKKLFYALEETLLSSRRIIYAVVWFQVRFCGRASLAEEESDRTELRGDQPQARPDPLRRQQRGQARPREVRHLNHHHYLHHH